MGPGGAILKVRMRQISPGTGNGAESPLQGLDQIRDQILRILQPD